MSKKKVVVSLGHDALGYTTSEQRDAVQITAKALADLVEEDWQLTITHSNGPQVSIGYGWLKSWHQPWKWLQEENRKHRCCGSC